MGDCGAKRSFSLSPGFNVNEAAALDVCTGGEDEEGKEALPCSCKVTPMILLRRVAKK